eukprot:13217463-Heterocapsa_arctica.AAC.1
MKYIENDTRDYIKHYHETEKEEKTRNICGSRQQKELRGVRFQKDHHSNGERLRTRLAENLGRDGVCRTRSRKGPRTICQRWTTLWDMETILLHEELNADRTCSHGQTIVSGLLCHNTKSYITCSANKSTKELNKLRTGIEAADIIEVYRRNKAEIDQMTEVEII